MTAKDVEIPGGVMKRAIALALEEMSAGMTEGHKVAGMRGRRPNGDPVLIRSIIVALVPTADTEPQNGLRLATYNGHKL